MTTSVLQGSAGPRSGEQLRVRLDVLSPDYRNGLPFSACQSDVVQPNTVVVSYEHAYALMRAHGETGWTAAVAGTESPSPCERGEGLSRPIRVVSWRQGAGCPRSADR